MNIETIIERYIVEEFMFGEDSVHLDPDQSLISTGILDSLALIRLIAFFQEQFDVTIEDGEVIPEYFESINSMKALIMQKKMQST